MRMTGKLQENKEYNFRDLISLLDKKRGLFSKEMFVLNLLILLGVLAIFLSLIFYAYLEKKLNDPYVNQIDVNIGFRTSEDTLISARRRSKEIQFVNSVTMYRREPRRVRIINSNQNKYQLFFGRTFNADTYNSIGEKENDIVINTILETSNVLFPRNENVIEEAIQQGVIVTKRLLENCGYDLKTTHIYLWNEYGKNHSLAVPVIGVVKKLPGRSDIAYSEQLFDQYFSRSINNTIKSRYPLVLAVPSRDSKSIESMIDNFLLQENWGESEVSFSGLPHANDGDFTLIKFVFQIDSFQLENRNIDLFYEDLGDYLTKKSSVQNQIFRMFTLNDPEPRDSTLSNKDYMTIHLKPRNYIDLIFGRFIGQNYDQLRLLLLNSGLDVDYSKIRRQELLPVVLTLFIALGFMSYVLTVIFIYHYVQIQVKKYLHQLRKSYGQLKAIGLSKSKLLEINTRITTSFLKDSLNLRLSKSIKISRLLLLSIFLVIGVILLNSRGIISLDSQLILIFILGNSVIFWVTKKILLKSVRKEVEKFVEKPPGELIYS